MLGEHPDLAAGGGTQLEAESGGVDRPGADLGATVPATRAGSGAQPDEIRGAPRAGIAARRHRAGCRPVDNDTAESLEAPAVAAVEELEVCHAAIFARETAPWPGDAPQIVLSSAAEGRLAQLVRAHA
jgi:hypothetical protein